MAEQKTIDKMNELLQGHCWAPLKEAAEEWLKAVGTDAEAVAQEKLIPMLQGGVATVDEIIDMLKSDEAKAKFGDMAEPILQHAKELKAKGEKFCDCPACTKARKILEELGEKLD